MQRGGAGAGGFGGTAAGRSPSFSQPRANASGVTTRNPYASNANGGTAAAGAGFTNRNQNQLPNNGAGAAGAGFANRNQNQLPNNGAGVAGAAIANHNGISNAGAAAAGAGYANRNNYDAYHPGMSYGYWNGNYGATGLGGYTGMVPASGAYGYGGGGAYANPYAVGGGQVAAGSDYTQPLDTSAAPPDTPPPTDANSSPVGQARQAFANGDYDTALRLTRQALAGMPNDVTLHEFLGLILFAQGKYEDAAAPLYAVLSVGPGWDWTTLISNYSDADVYTGQLRGLEAFVKANPKSAKGQFVLSYHYITQGQPDAAIQHLKAVVALQPDDAVSARLLSALQPPAPGEPAAATAGIDPAQLIGKWSAKAPPDATVTLNLSEGSRFLWEFTPKGQKPMTVTGTFALADGVLTLNGKDAPGGPLAGHVALADARHMSFKAVAGPPDDPGLQFSR
jgi:tetratricopeptide (TPR) repeat protein